MKNKIIIITLSIITAVLFIAVVILISRVVADKSKNIDLPNISDNTKESEYVYEPETIETDDFVMADTEIVVIDNAEEIREDIALDKKGYLLEDGDTPVELIDNTGGDVEHNLLMWMYVKQVLFNYYKDGYLGTTTFYVNNAIPTLLNNNEEVRVVEDDGGTEYHVVVDTEVFTGYIQEFE